MSPITMTIKNVGKAFKDRMKRYSTLSGKRMGRVQEEMISRLPELKVTELENDIVKIIRTPRGEA